MQHNTTLVFKCRINKFELSLGALLLQRSAKIRPDTMEQNKSPKPSAIPGLAIIGLLITGILGCVHAFIFASGLGLIAAALAFGFLFYVSFK